MHVPRRIESTREDDAIWRRHESTIRQLYQEDRKTLKEVKEIMENERGFPVTPISVWEVKLRQLKMQKKLKARDWASVYQHVRPRLQRDGKMKLLRPTVVLINGTEKPLVDCWKEFRRNKVLCQRDAQDHLPPLPPGVLIRTPSPELLESTPRIQEKQSPEALLFTLFQTTVVSFQSLLDPHWPSTALPSDVLVLADSAYGSCLEGIAFTKVFEIIPNVTQYSLPSPNASANGSQHDQITSSLGFLDQPAAFGHSASWRAQLTGIVACLSSPLESATPNSQDLRLNFDSHHYLFLVVYLLSNGHLRSYSYEERHTKMATIFEMTFRFVSRRVLLALFQSNLPSIRAAWEKLLPWAGRLEHREAFSVLMGVGMDMNWLEETVNGHEYLYHAAQTNCGSLVKALLARGCRPDSSFGEGQRTTAIMAAVENGDLDSAKLLIRHCDVNREMHMGNYRGKNATNFELFIRNFCGTDEAYHYCLDLFLDQGADVDYKLRCGLKFVNMIYSQHRLLSMHDHSIRDWSLSMHDHSIRDWSLSMHDHSIRDWSLSILDYVFYRRRSSYSKLATFSKTSQAFSRSRALGFLEQGVHVLQEYLQRSTESRQQQVGWLTILLVEQFLLARDNSNSRVCCQAVLRLSELGADLELLSTRDLLADGILIVIAELATSGVKRDGEDGCVLMRFFLNRGFQVRASTLVKATQDGDSTRLKWLATYCPDLRVHGVEALAEAVARKSFKATKILLDGGVDPNSAFCWVHSFLGETKTNIFGVAAMGSTLAMTKYLARRGGKPLLEKPGGHSSKILVDLLLDEYVYDLFAKVKYIIEEHLAVSEPFYPSEDLLDACFTHPWAIKEKMRIFEYLLGKGARLTTGYPVASWIAAGGRHELVRKMLDLGADVNQASEVSFGIIMHAWGTRLTPLQAAAGIGDYDLVCWLLERGADLNPPVHPYDGTTALQEICAWDPVRPEERKRKDDIIRLFLGKGTDVNTVSPMRKTALHCAARLGDLPTAFLLLKHGAKPNAPFQQDSHGIPQTALDVAARYGRLDMVEFLLNANALSGTAFSCARLYEGAIEMAVKGKHFAVADLIRKHSAGQDRGWGFAHDHQSTTTMAGLDKTQQPVTGSTWRSAQGPSGVGHHMTDSAVNRYENVQVCLATDLRMINSKPSSEVREESTTLTETTGSTGARAIEEVQDKSQLADSGGKVAFGDDGDNAADQNTFHCEVSSWAEWGVQQPEGQVWDGDDEQNDVQLILESLSTDVFMGFSEF
ncbi:hypothetical protein KVR01_009599 [Diaporthe batatas]|uniref:uncharacterized protein n=1 Tax=Diaporthe batatas TaxID=748121 RepID=UPI001D0437D4|nr:uncharacterized protein KVR01_009599 [Diaporthe batatas]KAG8161335.1 hypothetical protein KVR01_009599 [Diaporthe batatas]